MRRLLLRTLQVLGAILILAAIPVLVVYPDARPAGGIVLLLLAIGAALGVVTGLVIRYVVPLDRRLRAIRTLSPRIGGRPVDRFERDRGALGDRGAHDRRRH